MEKFLDSSLKPFLAEADIHVDASDDHSSQESLHALGPVFIGDNVSLSKVQLSFTSRFLIRNPPDSFVFAIADSGQSAGVVVDRDIRLFPGRLSFALLPGEVLKLQQISDHISGFLFKVSAQSLLHESHEHGADDPCLSSLVDTLPGHETLLIACAKQLLDACSDESSVSSRMIRPLEDSIFSLLASLVGSQPQPARQGIRDVSTHSNYVQLALSHMENHLSDQINLSDLCNVCCVSARTLQISFQSVMNRTPLSVLQEMRLTRLRDMLLNGSEVSRACKCVGLTPSGRLSASYKKLFGELPRQTRLRKVI